MFNGVAAFQAAGSIPSGCSGGFVPSGLPWVHPWLMKSQPFRLLVASLQDAVCISFREASFSDAVGVISRRISSGCSRYHFGKDDHDPEGI